jgi:hypothetical protein
LDELTTKNLEELSMFPGPMEYLKSHALAFIAGAATILIANTYTRVMKKWDMKGD